MLAILTKMTLTQVSTWFANARRRLKKENKMTWSPRNRCGERKDSEGYSDEEDDDDEDTKTEEDLIKPEEKDSFRMTTVIKSPEGKFFKELRDILGRQFRINTTLIQRLILVPSRTPLKMKATPKPNV